jgi:ribonuclease P protein component
MVFSPGCRPVAAGKSFRDAGGRGAHASPSRHRPTSKQGGRNGCLDEAFGKEDRLLKRADFVRVQKRGKKLETRSLLILVYPGRKGRTRLGIAVSKRFGSSVARNRVKRVVREVFRRNRSLFPKSADVVVVPKRVRHHVEYHGLVEEMMALRRRRR